MPIEKVRLKDGSEYPVSPAWREPVVPGREMDYSFAADTEDVGAAVGLLSTDMTMTGGDHTEDVIPILKLLDEVFSVEELRAASGNAVGVFSDQNDDIMELSGELVFCGAAQANSFVRSLIYIQSAGELDPQFTDLEGNCAIATWRNTASVLFLISTENSGTFTQELTLMDGAATITVTQVFPEAGTYCGILPFDWIPQENIAVTGSLTVAKYHLDPRFARGVRDVVLPLIITMPMAMGVGAMAAPAGFENLEESLRVGAEHGDQLNVIMDANLIGSGWSVQTTALYKNGGEATWTFDFELMGNHYIGFRYNAETHVFSLISDSEP